MSDWLVDLVDFQFRDDYTEGRTKEADGLQALADTYPVESSPVADQLSAASSALLEGQEALDGRRYGDAEERLGSVESILAPTPEQIVKDLEALESDTGYRIPASVGPVEGYGTKEATVEDWVDGDTVKTSRGTVRLVGVDTPEVSDQCSQAKEATRLVESLAPEGSTVTLVSPWAAPRTDRYDRKLRYVELEDGTDLGYTLLLNGLAKPRYDSRDGYQWHPHEKAYRGTGAEPDEQAFCSWSTVAGLVLAADDDDSDTRHRSDLLERVAQNLAESAALTSQIDSAKSRHQADDDADRVETPEPGLSDTDFGTDADRAETPEPGLSDSDFGTDADRPGYTGCRQYAPGGKTWKPIPCP